MTSFGALCDSATDDTLAIQRAIDACTYSAAVQFPANRTCLSFPLDLHNGSALHLPSGARLKLSSKGSGAGTRRSTASPSLAFLTSLLARAAFLKRR